MGEFRPDFKKAYTMANDILLMSRTILSLPVDIYGHIKAETEIKLYSYETAFRKCGLDIELFGSKDAVITEIDGRYILFYKKTIDRHRMRWSIGHESGHYYLGHNLDSRNISEKQYQIQEIEANFFAAQVLMPDQVIWELIDRGETLTRENLMSWFDVSRQAAEKRMETINRQSEYRDYYINKDDSNSIVLKFGACMERMSPKKYWQISFDEEEKKQKEREEWLY